MLRADEARDRRGLEPDARGLELGARLRRHVESAVREDDHLARPSAKHESEGEKVMLGCGRREISPPPVFDLPAVTIRALEDRVPPALAEAIDGEHFVDHARAEDH